MLIARKICGKAGEKKRRGKKRAQEGEKMSNYEKMLLAARELFLQRDQEEMIRKWDLDCDDDHIYFSLFSQALRLERKTAIVSPAQEGGYPLKSAINESMIIFDLLTLAPVRPRLKGRWESISGLGGVIGAGHDRLLGHRADAELFAGNAGELARACEKLGAVSFGKADVGYIIPVFEDLCVLFQFWDADDEFPAQIKYLFDANALQFLHYETLWYVMGGIAARLKYHCGK